MTREQIIDYIMERFEGVEQQEAFDTHFFFLDPEKRFAFATIMTRDNDYDDASNLNREGVFRLNIGVSKQRYEALLGKRPSAPRDGAKFVDTGHDFTALDTLMPHPIYASMGWVSVLSPSEETFAHELAPLLDEAYAIDAAKHGVERREPEDDTP